MIINKNDKLFIIGEIGVNHNGSIHIAKKLIDMAVRNGCSAVKFQKRTIDKVYTKEFLDSHRESPWGKTQRVQKEALEFGKKEFDIIDAYCKEKGIHWFASPWDEDSVYFLEQYNLKYNKIASPMLTHKKVLKETAKLGKLTFISTGLSTLEEIDDAVNIFRSYKCPFVLMHCIGTYPSQPKQLNLNIINTLKKRYDCEVGYSSHSTGILDSIIAAVLGTKYIEMHITLDRAMYGSDQASSKESHGIETIIKYCKYVPIMLGSHKKVILPEEKEIAKKLRPWQEY